MAPLVEPVLPAVNINTATSFLAGFTEAKSGDPESSTFLKEIAPPVSSGAPMVMIPFSRGVSSEILASRGAISLVVIAVLGSALAMMTLSSFMVYWGLTGTAMPRALNMA
jgi:hypothetical protein